MAKVVVDRLGPNPNNPISSIVANLMNTLPSCEKENWANLLTYDATSAMTNRTTGP